MQKDVIVSAVLAAPTTAQPRAREVSSLMRVGEQAFASPYTVRVQQIEPIPDTDQVAVTFLVTGEDAPAHEFTETGNQVVAAFLDAAMRANPNSAGGITVQKIEAGGHGADNTIDDRPGADALSDLAPSAERPASATPAPTPLAPPQPTSTITPGAPAGDVPTLPVAPPITAERPTTVPSSPVQGQSQRGEHAGAEEVSEGGPFPDAPPPDRS